jgi:hypothetical protein
MISKIFSPKNVAKIGVFLHKLRLVYAKNDHNFGFKQDSPKIGKNRRKL